MGNKTTKHDTSSEPSTVNSGTTQWHCQKHTCTEPGCTRSNIVKPDNQPTVNSGNTQRHYQKSLCSEPGCTRIRKEKKSLCCPCFNERNKHIIYNLTHNFYC